MTARKPPAAPDDTTEETTEDTTEDTSTAGPSIGDVVRVGDGYALVVGFETVRHQHEDANGERTKVETREHPLLVDLPAPRRHELGLTS